MFVVGLFLSLLLIVSPLYADVTADPTLGTIVDPSYNTDINEYLISGGQYIGNENRGNLFHSFEQFNLESFEDAIFIDEGLFVDNIITRVTGGESNINGGIISKIAGANLYFLNPNGIIFGESAYLDIDGSVYMSTANSLTLDDNTVFHTADFSQDHLLSTASPYAFGFLSNPAPISASDAYLQMYAGTELALIGGNINLEYSSLEAFSGAISLVSVGSEGQVIFDEETGTYTNIHSFEQLGDITLVDYKLLPELDGEGNIAIDEETGEELYKDLGTVNVSGDIGGNVFIRAENFVITDFAKIYATAYDSIDFAATPAFVDIDARGDVTISNDSKIDVSGSAGGNIFIQANNLVMTDYGEIYADIGDEYRTHSDTPDKASVIDIDVNHDITIVNSSGIEASNFDDSTEGASVYIRAQNLEISGFKDDNPEETPSGISIGESSNSPEARAGVIDIDINTLDINDAGFLESYTDGRGYGAGEIFIKAAKSILIEGVNNNEKSYISTAIGYNYDEVKEYIDDDGTLVKNEYWLLEESGLGNAGNIDIDTPLLSLNNNATISSGADSNTQGQAGSINITSNRVRINNQSGIYAFNDGQGDAGFVNINSNQVEILNSDVHIYSETGKAGNINVNGNVTYLENVYLSTDGVSNPEEYKRPNINSFTEYNVNLNAQLNILNRSYLLATDGINIKGYYFYPHDIDFATSNFEIFGNDILPVQLEGNFLQAEQITIENIHEGFPALTLKLSDKYQPIGLATNKCFFPENRSQFFVFEQDTSTLSFIR